MFQSCKTPQYPCSICTLLCALIGAYLNQFRPRRAKMTHTMNGSVGLLHMVYWANCFGSITRFFYLCSVLFSLQFINILFHDCHRTVIFLFLIATAVSFSRRSVLLNRNKLLQPVPLKRHIILCFTTTIHGLYHTIGSKSNEKSMSQLKNRLLQQNN